MALKALAKEPGERYAAAGDFAADLRRWLNHQTIRARRPSLRQRADKWLRRHSAAVLAAAVALLIGTGVSTWLAVKARDAERRAADEAAVAKAVSNFLQRDLLRQANIYAQRDDGFIEEPNLTVKSALDRAAGQVGQRFLDQPLVEAAIRVTIGESYCGLRESRLAVPHLERAVELRTAHLGDSHPEMLDGLHALAKAYQGVGRRLEANSLLRRILETSTATYGPDHEVTLNRMVSLAMGYSVAGQWQNAEPLLDRALAQRLTRYGTKHWATASCTQLLAQVYANTGRLSESLELNEKAQQAYEATIGRDHYDTLQCIYIHIWTCQKAKMAEKANDLMRELLDRARRRGDLMGRVNIARALNLMGQDLLLQGKPAAAEPLLREALALNRADDPQCWRTFDTMSRLGEAIMGLKQYAAAGPLLLEGYEGLKQQESIIPALFISRLIDAGERVARFYEATGAPERARAWREKLTPE